MGLGKVGSWPSLLYLTPFLLLCSTFFTRRVSHHTTNFSSFCCVIYCSHYFLVVGQLYLVFVSLITHSFYVSVFSLKIQLSYLFSFIPPFLFYLFSSNHFLTTSIFILLFSREIGIREGKGSHPSFPETCLAFSLIFKLVMCFD